MGVTVLAAVDVDVAGEGEAEDLLVLGDFGGLVVEE